MKTLITNSHSMGERMNWEHGEHSGTITFPGEERGPVDIQWDGDCPDDWEEIEAEVEAAAADRLCGVDESADESSESPAENAEVSNGDRERQPDTHSTHNQP